MSRPNSLESASPSRKTSGSAISALETSRIDTTETVGIRVDNNYKNGGISFESLSKISIGFHPCICCNVSLRTGVRILSIIEIVNWGVLFAFCIGALIYWLIENAPEVQFADNGRKDKDEYNFIRNVLITYTVFCGSFLILGIILLIGVIKMNRKCVLVWLIGTFGIEIMRMIFAIIIPLASIRYGLFYWFVRAYEFWAIISFGNKLRNKSGGQKSKGHRWRNRKANEHSHVPSLVPITYYGIFARANSNGSCNSIVGYQLQDPDWISTSATSKKSSKPPSLV